MTPDDERWMRRALDEARRAPDQGDVPVGCVVVCDGEIIASGRNERELRQDPVLDVVVINNCRDKLCALIECRWESCWRMTRNTICRCH